MTNYRCNFNFVDGSYCDLSVCKLSHTQNILYCKKHYIDHYLLTESQYTQLDVKLNEYIFKLKSFQQVIENIQKHQKKIELENDCELQFYLEI